MLTDERHQYILQRLIESGVIKSVDLIESLGCSESTIRRDLAQLESKGLLLRIHGGAKLNATFGTELTYQEKTVKNSQQKKNIGKFAASLLEKNDVIYLDAGTTTLEMIPFLSDLSITVVTNGIAHASMLADRHIESYLVGGKLKHSTKAMVGAPSQRFLKNYQFTKAFLGIDSIDMTYGCTTPDPEEASMKQLAIEQAADTYLLADDSKWNKVSFAKICDISDVSFITNKVSNIHQPYLRHTTILEVD
ncbi:DeoR/GlpR family DNA-binding transcription regulator [Oceanobacillus sp. J11TS1]|uniref:DeoR/GlpR family DNA-binding transcription regulator n=1 Tax=Oceanobacillus sp. J11TS1 TaxID=2807191 RepID=UPI001B13D147|nr:DeoR/GlpR family DNA-binding transcription regulator [Oceanobacillus sp. J11TS1]GIO25312.1 DeoR family transcriptional regulator [Oceanobacillus sp. J11TS1]